MFKIKNISKPKLKNPILIEGLPGMGNVGKIAIDFMVEHLDAKKFIEIKSKTFPSCVFVNETNLVELPKIELYYKNLKDHSLIFLTGDIQPTQEQDCHEFCEIILNIFQELKGKEIITMGGIGLPEPPKSPKVYTTANIKDIIKKYNQKNNSLYGLVGPIVGVSGLLLGLGHERKIPAISFLAETFGHPNYLGIKGSKEILTTLNKKLNLKLDLSELTEEIKEFEKDSNPTKLKKYQPKIKIEDKHLNYIG